MFKPRPKQRQVLDYLKGKMGVSAVPGSGKTQTLSYLTAKLIKNYIRDEEEVLVVTLVNSAVENFAGRVADFVRSYGLLPKTGYIVRTLHGLAHDIVREKPSLAGLSEDFQIIDERDGEELIKDVAKGWVENDDSTFGYFIDSGLSFLQKENIKEEQWPGLVSTIATAFIKRAKDLQKTPLYIREKLSSSNKKFPLVEMGLEIYEDYNRALNYRGAVDFDDLISLAYQILKLDEDYLKRLCEKWIFILEDEAQDSSFLQESILRVLSKYNGNWVRVGDPNQAIYETFTTANPEYLRSFLREYDVTPCELPDSGRSTKSIIALANYLIYWTKHNHPVKELRDSLTEPFIEPTPEGDPQPNPEDNPEGIQFINKNFTSEGEVRFIGSSLSAWLPENKNSTVAVLVPTNKKGIEIAEELKKRKVNYLELLRSARSTRETAGALTYIIRYLANPVSSGHLSMVYKVWRRDDRDDELSSISLEKGVRLLRGCRNVEDFLWPRSGKDWLLEEEIENKEPEIYKYFLEFRDILRKWQEMAVLPVDQLILVVSQDLFRDPQELAIAHRLAVVMGQMQTSPLDLPQMAYELKVIANNERKFIGLTEEDTGFEPEKHKGKVIITTMHRAKGLEWDRVYLMSVNNYSFPSAMYYDSFISEKWFVRNRLNLQAEALAQLETLLLPSREEYVEGKETKKARFDYGAERLRLLYVGITRAKKELFISWNSGNRGELKPALPFIALQKYWERRKS